jgi:uncharacterized membrane protein
MVVLRWAHGLATIVWLGGSAYAALILRPRLREAASGGADREALERLRAGTGQEFGRWVNGAIVVFVVSGVLLSFDRLAGRGATVEYGIVLALKVVLALWMFGIGRGLGRRRDRPGTMRRPPGRFGGVRERLGSPGLLLWLGAIVVLLAAVLKAIYEANLT